MASSGGASLRTGIVRARSTSRAALDEAVGALRPVAAGMAARRGCWSGGDGEGGWGRGCSSGSSIILIISGEA